MLMLIISFFCWWYLEGWKYLLDKFKAIISSLTYVFSIPIIIKTLFSPWKRITHSYSGKIAIDIRILFDNLFSRWIGMNIRIIFLITYALLSILLFAFLILSLLLWPILPLMPIIILFLGVIYA